MGLTPPKVCSFSPRGCVSSSSCLTAVSLSITPAELLEAKLACIDYIYHTKLQEELDKRLENANTLLEAIHKQTEQGESSLLDLNKIKLLQLEIKNQADLNQTSLKTLQHQLYELNVAYPWMFLKLNTLSFRTPGFEVVDSLIDANDPKV